MFNKLFPSKEERRIRAREFTACVIYVRDHYDTKPLEEFLERHPSFKKELQIRTHELEFHIIPSLEDNEEDLFRPQRARMLLEYLKEIVKDYKPNPGIWEIGLKSYWDVTHVIDKEDRG